MKEPALQMKETDRKMKETDRKIDKLGSKPGDLVEELIFPNILEKFNQPGYGSGRVEGKSGPKAHQPVIEVTANLFGIGFDLFQGMMFAAAQFIEVYQISSWDTGIYSPFFPLYCETPLFQADTIYVGLFRNESPDNGAWFAWRRA
ncbi:MAG: hypothetical protein LBE10_10360 [Treponema sp.]|jgi:hypothetical protein|nr:hypothetical protein [Treponema sp.]